MTDIRTFTAFDTFTGLFTRFKISSPDSGSTSTMHESESVYLISLMSLPVTFAVIVNNRTSGRCGTTKRRCIDSLSPSVIFSKVAFTRPPAISVLKPLSSTLSPPVSIITSTSSISISPLFLISIVMGISGICAEYASLYDEIETASSGIRRS